jgi:putative oxidoreductase
MFPHNSSEAGRAVKAPVYFFVAPQSSASTIRQSRQQINDPRTRFGNSSDPSRELTNTMNSSELSTHISRGYSLFAKGASSLASPFLLVVRLYWGWQFFVAGKNHLSDIPATVGHFIDFGVPFPKVNAVLAGSTECVFGLLLIAGIASRLTVIPLIFTMFIAYLTADNEALRSIFSDPDKFTGATPFLFLFACVLIFIFGPGAFSLDWLLGKKFGGITSAAPVSEPLRA